MKKTKTPITLSIFPNTYGFGYMCLDKKRNLIDYGMKSVKPMSNNELFRRFQNLIYYLRPDIILCRDHRTSGANKSKRTVKLIHRMLEHAKTKNLQTYQYTRDDIRDVFTQYDALNKYEIVEVLVDHYEELKYVLPQDDGIQDVWMKKEDYKMGIFDALALAYTHFFLHEE